MFSKHLEFIDNVLKTDKVEKHQYGNQLKRLTYANSLENLRVDPRSKEQSFNYGLRTPYITTLSSVSAADRPTTYSPVTGGADPAKQTTDTQKAVPRGGLFGLFKNRPKAKQEGEAVDGDGFPFVRKGYMSDIGRFLVQSQVKGPEFQKPLYQASYIAPQQGMDMTPFNQQIEEAKRLGIRSSRTADSQTNALAAMGMSANATQQEMDAALKARDVARQEQLRVIGDVNQEAQNRTDYENQMIQLDNQSKLAKAQRDAQMLDDAYTITENTILHKGQNAQDRMVNAEMAQQQENILQMERQEQHNAELAEIMARNRAASIAEQRFIADNSRILQDQSHPSYPDVKKQLDDLRKTQTDIEKEYEAKFQAGPKMTDLYRGAASRHYNWMGRAGVQDVGPSTYQSALGAFKKGGTTMTLSERKELESYKKGLKRSEDTRKEDLELRKEEKKALREYIKQRYKDRKETRDRIFKIMEKQVGL